MNGIMSWDSRLVLSGYELSNQGLLSTRFALAQLQGRLKNCDALTISAQALKSVERAGGAASSLVAIPI